jgi:hypothetical protein
VRHNDSATHRACSSLRRCEAQTMSSSHYLSQSPIRACAKGSRIRLEPSFPSFPTWTWKGKERTILGKSSPQKRGARAKRRPHRRIPKHARQHVSMRRGSRVRSPWQAHRAETVPGAPETNGIPRGSLGAYPPRYPIFLFSTSRSVSYSFSHSHHIE